MIHRMSRLLLLAMVLGGSPRIARRVEAPDPIVAVVPLGPSADSQSVAFAVAMDGRTGRTFAVGSDATTSQISVLDTATGAVVRSVTSGPAVQGGVSGIDVDEARGRALVLTDPGQGSPGRVSILSARDGHILNSAAVGLTPRPIALDERRGHFFALTTNADGHGRVAMIDTVTGRVLHTLAIATGDSEGPSGLALDEARGRLFVTTIDLDSKGYVSVLDTSNGAVVRTVALGSTAQGDGTMAADGRAGHVFVASGSNVRMLDARDGRVLRTVTTGVQVTSVVVNERTSHVFVSAGKSVLMLDARSGAVLGIASSPGTAGGILTSVESTGRVFLTTTADSGNVGLFGVLDATTGALVRTIAESGQASVVRAVDERTGRVFDAVAGAYKPGGQVGPGAIVVREGHSGLVRQSVQVSADLIVLNGRTGAAVALNRVNDTAIVLTPSFGMGTSPAPATPPARPVRPSLPRTLPIVGYAAAVDERTSHAFIDSADGVSVVDTATGALLRTVDIGGAPGGPGAVAVDDAASRVYVAIDDTSRLAVLDARTGALLRTIIVAGRPRALALAERAGNLFIATADDPKTGAGGVSLFDTRTAAVHRVVVRAGADPGGIAVDRDSGLVFVTDKSAHSLSILDAGAGTLRRTVHTACYKPAGVVAVAGRAFVLGGDGVCVLDGRTSVRVHAYQGANSADGAVVDARTARVFVITNSNNFDIGVDVLDAHTGALLRRTHPNMLTSSSTSTAQPVVDERQGRVYVLLSSPFGRDNEIDGPGALAVLDAKTGAVIKDIALTDTVAAGPNFGLAIDARLHHLIVLTDNHVTTLDATRLG